MNRRITEDKDGTGTTHATVRLYYSTQWQVLEERENASTTAKRQNVWRQVYVDAMILRDRDTDGSTANGLE